MNRKQFLQDTIRDLEASIDYFGAGRDKQRARERWVVENFLRALGVMFEPEDILQPEHDPPDAQFQGAAFEVKEVQDPERRRGDEYKQQLAKARSAKSPDELMEGFTPQDVSVSEVYGRVIEEAEALARGRYRVEAVRRDLDLLFYVNLGMRTAWELVDGERPGLERLRDHGWRSVSFLFGASTACVIFARSDAPKFLTEAPAGAPFASGLPAATDL